MPSNPSEATMGAGSIVAIDRTRHRRVRIRPDPGFAHAAQSHLSPLVLEEFAPATADYPIVAVKDSDDGSFRAAALFGFAVGENYYRTPAAWQATYVPLNIRRYPFVVGIGNDGEGNGEGEGPLLCIDEASALVGDGAEGDALFDESGSESQTLTAARQMMARLWTGHRQTAAFLNMLLAQRLLAPLDIDLGFRDGSSRTVSGLYGIDEENLRGLDNAALHTLARNDWLLPLYAMLISRHQFNRLAQLHNAGAANAITRVHLSTRT
ncbi:MAG: hypothetical protein D6782_01240 [Alphaproteobacteria bacterium]|nr:MAG: hypothetical protein D6782_01240 [Alphaproteobacteria bacterium]